MRRNQISNEIAEFEQGCRGPVYVVVLDLARQVTQLDVQVSGADVAPASS